MSALHPICRRVSIGITGSQELDQLGIVVLALVVKHLIAKTAQPLDLLIGQELIELRVGEFCFAPPFDHDVDRRVPQAHSDHVVNRSDGIDLGWRLDTLDPTHENVAQEVRVEKVLVQRH